MVLKKLGLISGIIMACVMGWIIYDVQITSFNNKVENSYNETLTITEILSEDAMWDLSGTMHYVVIAENEGGVAKKYMVVRVGELDYVGEFERNVSYVATIIDDESKEFPMIWALRPIQGS